MKARNMGWLSMIVLAGCLYGKKEESRTVPESIVRRIDGLGWIQYGDGWQEADHYAVAQIGLEATGVACPEGSSCFVREVIDDVESNEAVLDATALREHGLSGQFAVGRGSAVIVTHCKGQYLVTAGHISDIDGHVILGHNDEVARTWGKEDVLAVPAENVKECQFVKLGGGDECREGAIQVCKLDVPQSAGVPLRTSVAPGLSVQATMHPLGLPMKQSAKFVDVSVCEESCCWAHVDNATGGTGGAVLDSEGKLAGVLCGTGVRESIFEGVIRPRKCKRGFRGSARKQDECKQGQAFVRAETIARLLEEYER